MNSEILNKFLIEMAETLKEAKDFSLQQIPIIAREILTYSLAVDAVWLVLGLGFFVLSLKFWKWVYKIVEDDLGFVGWYILPGIATSVSLFVAVTAGMECLKIWLAPRVFLLEYIAHLILPHKGA